MLTEGLSLSFQDMLYLRDLCLCSMALIKDMISSPKIQLLKAPFLVFLIATDHSEVSYDAKQNINPFWEIRAYTLVLSELIFQEVATEIDVFVNFS